MLADFIFEETTDIPDNSFIVLAGEEGSGKTHRVCSMSEQYPVYLLDTEKRGHIVVNKFKRSYPDRFLAYKQVSSYHEIVVAMKAALRDLKTKGMQGVIGIDSGTELQQFAELRYKEVAKVEKIWPQYLWAQIWEMCDEIIKEIRDSGHILVMTTRMKEEYAGDKATGNKVPRIYNRVPYNADILLHLERDKNRPILIAKNGYAMQQNVELSSELSLLEIINKCKE